MMTKREKALVILRALYNMPAIDTQAPLWARRAARLARRPMPELDDLYGRARAVLDGELGLAE